MEILGNNIWREQSTKECEADTIKARVGKAQDLSFRDFM